MKKILCPVDFSQASINGLHYAYELAHYLDIELILFHALPQENDKLSNYELVEIEETAKERLEDICRHLSRTGNRHEINYHFLVKKGDTCNNIQRIISDKKIDMVILGTKGIEDPSKPYGSFAAEMIARTTCPLIVVPQRIDFSLIKNIVYATDLKEDESLLIKFVQSFSNHTQAHITFVNVNDLPVNGEELQQLNLYKRKQSTFHRMEGTDTLEGINTFAELHKADLIVMSTSQRKQLDNVLISHTREMVFKIKTPLLIMHKADNIMDGL